MLLVVTALGGAAIAAAAGAGFAYWVLHEEDMAGAWAIAGASAAGVCVGTVLAGGLQERRSSKAVAGTAPYEVAVRAVDGAVHGLGRGWTHAAATVSGGQLRLVPYALGLRPLRRAPVTLDVADVVLTDRRSPARSLLLVTPGLPVVELGTPDGGLELVVERASVDSLVERLHEAVRGPDAR